MATCCNPYRGFRYPAEVIQYAVWLYHCFNLSLRDVETILAACGVLVSYESIREWGLRFGRLFVSPCSGRCTATVVGTAFWLVSDALRSEPSVLH